MNDKKLWAVLGFIYDWKNAIEQMEGMIRGQQSFPAGRCGTPQDAVGRRAASQRMRLVKRVAALFAASSPRAFSVTSLHLY